MNYAIIELRKDGTRWRHEMDATQFDAVMKARTYFYRKAPIKDILELYEKHVPGFMSGVTSRQLVEKPEVQGFEPTVIFCDEVMLDYRDSKPVKIEDVPLMQWPTP